MTRMLPERLPAETPAAEVTMFEIIRTAKDLDDCYCLHSLGIARHRRKNYAEADLVFIGPQGIFCLEVKGGHVVRHAGSWTIGWPGGKTYESIEGPFAQAQGVRWALHDFIVGQLGKKFRDDLLLGWGVAFPDIIFEQKDPEWDQDVIFDQKDKTNSFSAFVQRLEGYFRERQTDTGRPQPPRLSPTRIKEIVTALRGDFEVVPSLRGLLAESHQDLVRLSREQYAVLDYCLNDRNSRIICQGAAGTGKTLIAMEAAKRLAASGKKTLLVCFNDNLQRFLSLDTAECERLQTTTIHRFIGEIIRKAGLGGRLASARTTLSEGDLFEKAYAELFESAATLLLDDGELPQFDAIIVDEAQDILNMPMMNCLDLVLDKGFSSGTWLLFLDSGLQADIYARMDEKLLKQLDAYNPATFVLIENFRNPKGVVTEMCVLTGAEEPICRRDLVSKVEYISWNDEKEQGRKLRALLLDLFKQGIEPGHITVLSGRRREQACISLHPPDLGKAIVYLDSDRVALLCDAISAASVSSFKGLENEILILTDLPPLEPMDSWGRSIFYVGMTRAKSKLFALVNQEFLNVRTRA